MNCAPAATQISCPECKDPLVILLRLEMTSMVTAEVRFDLSAVWDHVGEHLATETGLGDAAPTARHCRQQKHPHGVHLWETAEGAAGAVTGLWYCPGGEPQ
jgi:hypothetical protein